MSMQRDRQVLTMKRMIFCLMTAAIVILPANAFAGIMVTLSSPDDLLNLSPSQVVTINVNVSGIGVGDSLSLLGADVLLPANVFGPPTTPLAGAAVPDAATTFDPNSTMTAGVVDHSVSGTFLDVSVSITANGGFFSFQAIVIGSGLGQVRFDPGATPSVFGTNSANDPLDVITAGSPLNVKVNSSVVPEPGALAIWSLLAGVALFGWRRREQSTVRGEIAL